MKTAFKKTRWFGVPLALTLAVMAFGPIGRGVAGGTVGRAGPGTKLSGGITFDHSFAVDPYYLVGEPDIAFDHSGNIYASGPDGTTTQISVFWKSSDGGIQWHPMGVLPPLKPNSASGGGDTEFSIGKDDTIYGSDLQALQCQATFVSHDHGDTFTAGEGCIPETDRQWMGNYTDSSGNTRVYLASNNLAEGCYMLVSTNGGIAYLPPAGGDATGVIDGNGCDGPFVVDQRNGDIYVPMGGGAIEKSTDGAVTWHVVGHTTARADLFAPLTMDSAGNLYQVGLSDTGSIYSAVNIYVSKDSGVTWSKHQVNTPDIKQMIMPWVVAGSAGRVAVAFYGTSDTGSTGGFPGSPSAGWHVYTAFSTNATAATPKFTQVQADEHIMHKGAICDGGFPGCLLADADRSMADFFEVGIDKTGRVYVVYNDNADISSVTNIGRAYVAVARERTGPNLLKGDVKPPTTGNVTITSKKVTGHTVKVAGKHGLPPGNWTTDPSGDALYPVTPTQGPNIPAMDIKESSVSDSGGNLTFKMSLADLSPAALAQAAQAAGEPVWAFTWWWNNAHYFAQWRGGTQFEYGQVQSIDWPGLGAPAPKFLTYVPSGTATGTQTGNDLTITVPASGVGNPKSGDKLDNISAWAWSVHSDIPKTVDQAKTYSYVVGTPQSKQHAADGYVQVSVDSKSFKHPVLATLNGSSYSATLGGLAAGNHTIYVRQVLSAALYTKVWDDVVAGPIASAKVRV